MTSFNNNVMLLSYIAITFLLHCAWGQGCSKEQTRALLEIRNSTNGSAFAEWDGRDCCDAVGFYCNIQSNTEIYEGKGIYLGKDSDSYKPPSSTWYPNVTLFTLFDELVELKLNSMNIGGELKPFCELKRLKHLSSLDLGNNKMEGTIHPCLGLIENLEQLDLSGNHFHGNVPPLLLSNQSKITLFDVSGNQLEGVLSISIFANNSNLDYLDLSNNYRLEVETESPSWVPTFHLSKLNLANCNLNKNNGHVIPSFISTQYLNWLDLSHNSIEGSIPCQLLFNSSIQGLFLRSNKLAGSFLDCKANNQTSSIVSFDISDNHVKGPLPQNIGHLFPELQHCNMSSNALEGNIPWSLGNLSLEILDLSNNMLSGTLPQSLTTNGSTLVYLNLANNKLQGEMLPRDSDMPNLECLQLSGNHFEGIISPTISNSPSLVILDVRYNHLSGNIPKWLYNHPSLVAVLLRGNQLEGHLLRRMCQMGRLQVLDISYNLISGGIPSCLDNVTFWKKISPSITGSNYLTEKSRLSYLIKLSDLQFEIGTSLLIKSMEYTFSGIPLSLMTGIDMSSNQLSGSIPSEIGELSQLRSLNLSNNFLTGSIPISFQNLKNVESLDLSHNNLSGKIPFELVQLTYLSTFSVAYNNLSGRIPFERQFSTFTWKSYDGNPDLCGEPLPRNCSPTTNQLNPEHDKDQKEGTRVIDSPLFFYAFVAISYAFGFWVFFGILIIKKNWRLNYFRAVDRWIESFLKMLSKYW